MIKVGILTSSRADYGIYLPLLKAMLADKIFDLKIIVFGTHLSKLHGNTITQIENDGFPIFAKIESLISGDSAHDIASSYALTTQKFADFWNEKQSEFDIVFALGDRFEMAAAVAASIPFQINIAHLHGGETTLGAIDNIYRHFISLASKFHFVSTEAFALRVKELLDSEQKLVYNIGSLSLENLDNIDFLSKEEFNDKWKIDLKLDTILVTVHPETIDFEKNKDYSAEISEALEQLATEYQIVITMPNADTNGMIFRNSFNKLAEKNTSIKIIENFGTQSYFTCMKYAKLLIGNTSSGIIEAASFQKYVLNIGNRQKGRLHSNNVINLPFEKEAIILNTKKYIAEKYEGENIYFQAKPSLKIINILKENYGSIF